MKKPTTIAGSTLNGGQLLSAVEGYAAPIQLRPLRAVIWDWDGVITDSVPAAYAGTRNIFLQAGSGYDLTLDEYYERFDHATRHQFFEERGVRGIPEQKLSAWFHEDFDTWRRDLFPDLIPALDSLGAIREPELLLVIVSGNKNRGNIIKTLRQHGIGDRFVGVWNGVDDKTPTITEVLDKIGVTASSAALIGDSVSDMEAAYRAGVGLRVGVERHPILGAKLRASPATSTTVEHLWNLHEVLLNNEC